MGKYGSIRVALIQGKRQKKGNSVCSKVQRKPVWHETSAFPNGGKSPLGEKCVMYQKKLVFLQF